MKRVINGKRYDTDTATRVHAHDNGAQVNDFHYYSEDLYQKKTGEFFLLKEGGAMSPAGRSLPDGGMGWGEDLYPLTDSEARQWAERNMDADKYEAIWGPVPE